MTTPTRLFSRILSLAIQGKLVSNHADDSVDDLLKEIAANNSARKKSKSDPISDDQIPFQIPDNWKWVRLGEICDVRDGTHDSPSYIDTGYPLITSKDFSNGKFDFSKTKYIAKEDYEEIIKRSKVDVDDILMSMIGGNIGSLIIIDNDNYFDMAIKNVALFKKSDIIKPVYLLFFLMEESDEFKKIAIGGAQPFVSLKVLRNYPFPLPPLSIQSRIVSKLNEIKALVDECENIENGLEKDCELLRKKVLDLALRGRLTTQLPSDGDAQSLIDQIEAEKAKSSAKNKKYIPPQPVNPDDAPFQIPKNWKWVRACDVFESMESIKPTGEIFKYIDIDAIDNKANKYVAKEVLTINAPSRASRRTQKGDVLFSMVRPYLKNITIVEEDDCIASTGFYVCRSKAYYPYFLLYLMLSNYVVDGLNAYMKGDNSPSINGDNILNFLLPLPPLAEQSRIVAKIEEVFAQIDNLRI